MGTINFKTKTLNFEQQNPTVEGYWPVAIDIGYSAVKLFSPNKVAGFPSYARKVSTNSQIGEASPKNIMYQDLDTNETWCVGEVAQDRISINDTEDTLETLYGRRRYFSPMFKVLIRTGIGIGMMQNRFGSSDGKMPFIQTGLPPAYLAADTADLIESFCGTHRFQIKIGEKPWHKFEFTITENDVDVMPQPMGTLYSISTDKYGKRTPDANKLFSSSLLIIDPGFGTFDMFGIEMNHVEDNPPSFDLGMKQVLIRTSERIHDKFGQTIPVPAMQKYLGSGEINCINKRDFSSHMEPFEDLLMESNREICEKAIAQMLGLYDIFEQNYLVITGGTGAAWKNIIEEKFKNIESLTILMGNRNDQLPLIFSNVRGYYMRCIRKLQREQRGKAAHR